VTFDDRKDLERLFHLLTNLGPEEREEALERESVSPEIREKLERMLSLDGREPGTMQSTLPAPARPRDPGKGDRIDEYLLMERIGEGGMGEVFLARQEEPIRREVALKVIKRGMDSKGVVARFEAERQALALMDHPAVAKVLGAGTTPGGRPYFVMEHVRGVPITDHCDRHQLDTRARLDLFLRVCDGVQHAHQKAIIHRDLKPSNILVSVQDGVAAPRIIDFGVAKATAQRLTERTLYTEMGMLIGTPEYMSPEQAEMTGQGIDTRTDVYSLGVILYELLTGALPFESKELRKEGYASIQRVLREKEPPRPSARVSTLGGDRSGEHARRRRVDANTLRRLLSGDLDWIAMKALEKDRMRRYGSPAELADDIRRHLRDEPVLAGPPSTGYRARKFVRRHKGGVVAASAGLVLLIAFAATMAVQARRIAGERDRADAAATQARKEAETAQRVSALMTDLFARSDPGRARGREVTVREVLDAGAEQVLRELGEEPEVQARLLATIGDSYRGLALWDRAVEILEKALDKTIAVHGENSLEAARAKSLLAYPLIHLAQYGRADSLSRESLATMRDVLKPEDPEISNPINLLAFSALRAQRETGEVETLLREALALQRQAHGETNDRVATTLDHLGWILLRQGRYPESEETLRQALQIQRRLYGDAHPRNGYILQRLGYALKNQGRYDDALACFHGSIEVAERVYPGEHPEFGYSYRAVGLTLMSKGDMEGASEWTDRAVHVMHKFLEPDNPELADTLVMHGRSLVGAGAFREADGAFAEAERIYRTAFGDSHEQVALSLRERGDVARRLGRLEEAESQLREALAIQLKTAGTSPALHWEQSRAASAPHSTRAILAMVLIEQGRLDVAQAEAEAAVDGLIESEGEDSRLTALARSVLGHCYAGKGDAARAEPLLRAGYAGLNAASPPTDPQRITSLVYLLSFYTGAGRISDAAPLRAELARITRPAAIKR